jgi:hypothetical protein
MEGAIRVVRGVGGVVRWAADGGSVLGMAAWWTGPLPRTTRLGDWTGGINY